MCPTALARHNSWGFSGLSTLTSSFHGPPRSRQESHLDTFLGVTAARSPYFSCPWRLEPRKVEAPRLGSPTGRGLFYSSGVHCTSSERVTRVDQEPTEGGLSYNYQNCRVSSLLFLAARQQKAGRRSHLATVTIPSFTRTKKASCQLRFCTLHIRF